MLYYIETVLFCTHNIGRISAARLTFCSYPASGRLRLKPRHLQGQVKKSEREDTETEECMESDNDTMEEAPTITDEIDVQTKVEESPYLDINVIKSVLIRQLIAQ